MKVSNESNQSPGHLYPCPYLPLRLLAHGSPAELCELPNKHKPEPDGHHCTKYDLVNL